MKEDLLRNVIVLIILNKNIGHNPSGFFIINNLL